MTDIQKASERASRFVSKAIVLTRALRKSNMVLPVCPGLVREL